MMALLVYSIKSALVLTLLYLPYTLMLRQESFFRMNRITLLTILMLARHPVVGKSRAARSL